VCWPSLVTANGGTAAHGGFADNRFAGRLPQLGTGDVHTASWLPGRGSIILRITTLHRYADRGSDACELPWLLRQRIVSWRSPPTPPPPPPPPPPLPLVIGAMRTGGGREIVNQRRAVSVHRSRRCTRLPIKWDPAFHGRVRPDPPAGDCRRRRRFRPARVPRISRNFSKSRTEYGRHQPEI